MAKAIEITRAASISEIEKEEITEALNLCISELPFAKWTREAIFDACNQFVLEHGRIRLRDFDEGELPSHPTIKNRFGMTAREFRDTFYPLHTNTPQTSLYRDFNREDVVKMFTSEFHRIKARSQVDYNKRRGESVPTWITAARAIGCDRWSDLLKSEGLSVYKQRRERETFIVESTSNIERQIKSVTDS